MIKFLSNAILLFILISCGSCQQGIQDYEAHKVKFAKTTFTAKNNEFSMVVPKGWKVKEDLESTHSDTLIYSLIVGSDDTSFVALYVHKLNLFNGVNDNLFDSLINEKVKRISNVELIEKSDIKIDTIKARTAFFRYELYAGATQEEINIFIPISENQFYTMALICDRNEEIENNFGMMMECAKSFKIKR